MITLHNIIIRYSDRFKRWYAYDSAGNLIYLDFSFCSQAPIVTTDSGHEFEILGKIQRPARSVDNGPIFVLLAAAFTSTEQQEVKG